MASKIQVRRGLKQDLPLLDSGEWGLSQDTQEVFMGLGYENLQLVKQKDTPYITPLHFGAKGDLSTDDTEAVRQAIRYAEINNVKLVLPKVFIITGELEIKAPITIEGVGASSNEGPLIGVKQISGFLVKGTGTKRIRTRMNYRASAADPQDAPLSVSLNVQSENVTLCNFSVLLDFDRTDNSPTNYGADWDIGIFNGCRTYFTMSHVHVLGYFREASIWVDVTHTYGAPRFKDLNGETYPNTLDISGADSMTMMKCYTKGGKWGLRIAGSRPKPGQAYDSVNGTGWYGNPWNKYYDEFVGSAINDRRGSYGFSDFNAYGCTFFGTDHHSYYRKNAMTGTYLTDTQAGGCMYIDGMAGNQMGRLQGQRFVSCRFASFEPYRVKLERSNRAQFYGCHFETGGSTVYNPDGSLVTRTAGVDIHGVSISATAEADNLIVIGSSGYLSREFIHSSVRFTDMFGASTIARSETTDEFVSPKLFAKTGIYATEVDNLSLKRMTDPANRTEAYVMRAYSTGNIEFMGASTVTFPGSPRALTDNATPMGTATYRWSTVYAGTGAINTSDEREKQQITSIPDEWLDAWADVEYTRFKFNDAVELKGDKARWHVGLIAQSVEETFKRHGLDAFEIGLLCYDEWEDQYEEIDGENILITPAGNRYGVRADECQFLELALMRRELQKLKQ